MATIVVEGVLFAVLLAVGGALLFWLLMLTPAGLRLRQTWNRRRLERDADRTCPIHGRHADADLVRLATGERVCPDCYRETLNGNVIH